MSVIKINSCKCCPVSFNWSLLGCKKSELLHYSGGWGRGRGCNLRFVMVNHVPESEKAPQQQQFPEQWDQHQKQSKTHVLLHLSASFGQNQPVFLNVCSLWTLVWEVCPGPARSPALTPTPPKVPVSLPSPLIIYACRLLFFSAYSLCHRRQQLVWNDCRVPGEVCGGDWEVRVQHEQDPPGASGPHRLHRCSSGERLRERIGALEKMP